MRYTMSTLRLTAAAVAAAGCSSPFGGRDCTSIELFAVGVRARDAVTGAPIDGGLTLILTGAQYDSASAMSGNVVAAGRATGTYTVTVRKARYREFTQENVVVTRDDCHVKTTVLDIALQPAQ